MQPHNSTEITLPELEPVLPDNSDFGNSADITSLLDRMAGLNASDLHLVSGRPPIYRTSDSLTESDGIPDLTEEQMESLFLDLCGSKDLLHVLKIEKGVDFAYEQTGKRRYRVNAVIQRGSINLTIRRIHSSTPDFDELGLPLVVRGLASLKKGLILVTGPVNSGKSTTMAAIIEHINQHSSRRIITIEDPVEYVYSQGQNLITQRELGSDVNKFADGLRSALRQDPDVILVGEMRDMETIAACLTAAETGHLVMSTLHTPNAHQAIDRIVAVFPSEQQQLVSSRLASLLEAVLYQMLVPTIDGASKVMAMEIMLATPAVRALIRDEKIFQIPNTIHTSRNIGMQTMDQALADLYAARKISQEELSQRCVNLDEVKRQLGL